MMKNRLILSAVRAYLEKNPYNANGKDDASVILDAIRTHLEKNLCFSCIKDDANPGTLNVYAANWGVNTTKKLSISVDEDSSCILLKAKFRGGPYADYADLCCVVNELNDVLMREAPGSCLTVTGRRRLCLHMCVPMENACEIDHAILRAFYLLHRYRNLAAEELNYLPDSEEEMHGSYARYRPHDMHERLRRERRRGPGIFYDSDNPFHDCFDDGEICDEPEEVFGCVPEEDESPDDDFVIPPIPRWAAGDSEQECDEDDGNEQRDDEGGGDNDILF